MINSLNTNISMTFLITFALAAPHGYENAPAVENAYGKKIEPQKTTAPAYGTQPTEAPIETHEPIVPVVPSTGNAYGPKHTEAPIVPIVPSTGSGYGPKHTEAPTVPSKGDDCGSEETQEPTVPTVPSTGNAYGPKETQEPIVPVVPSNGDDCGAQPTEQPAASTETPSLDNAYGTTPYSSASSAVFSATIIGALLFQ